MSKAVTLKTATARALIMVIAACPSVIQAEGIRASAELDYIESSNRVVNKQTGEATRSESTRLSQRYHLDFLKEIYPYVTVRAGGLFDLIDARSKTDTGRTENNRDTAAPFIELNLTNPVNRAGIAYRETEIATKADNLTNVDNFQEQLTGLWRWKAAGLPTINMDYSRIHTYDKPKTRDQRTELVSLKSRYGYRGISFDYEGSRVDTEQSLNNSNTQADRHNGRISYSTVLFNKRLSLNTSSTMKYSTLLSNGAGDIKEPTSSIGSAFYLLNDSSPERSEIDDYTSVDASNALSGINIGLGGPFTPTSFGLDFGTRTQVDTVYVLPVRDNNDSQLASPSELSALADSFVFRVFTSEDQEDWTELGVKDVIYDAFEDRFEISFAQRVRTRYIKILTSALTISAPGKILIGELQTYTTIADRDGFKFSTRDRDHSIGLRWAITDHTSASWHSNYSETDSDPAIRSETTRSNGLTLAHRFSPVFSSSARWIRSVDTAVNEADIINTTYSASIRANYLDTLSQSLIYSGIRTEEGDGTSSSDSIYLRNNADLYRDLSVNLDIGYSRRDPVDDEQSSTRLIRISTNLNPNPRLHSSIEYSASWTNKTASPAIHDQRGSFQVFWVPLATLSVSASLNYKDKTTTKEGSRVFKEYSISWSPLRDGSLSLNIVYSGADEGIDDTANTFSQQLQWKIARGMLLSFVHSKSETTSISQNIDTHTYRGNFRFFF